MNRATNPVVSDNFWTDEPVILLRDYLHFIPTKDMTTNQKLNAITLFSIYFALLILIFKKTYNWLYFPCVAIIVALVLHYTYRDNSKNSDKEHFERIVETGYIDSDNDVHFSRVTNQRTNKPEVSYTCRLPTPDNPFMNPAINDYNTNSPAACNSDDVNIQNTITKSFKSDLYMDIDDIFDKMNSQRQFYTVPNTAIPNDQKNFADWLYRSPTTCKEDQEQCLRYEDLRFKR